MKRFFLSAIALLFLMYFPVKAQITITSADLPVIGTMVVSAADTITPVSPGNAGPNQVWDLSNLVPMRYDTIMYLPVQGAPNYQNYPQANIVCDYSRITHGEGSENFYNYFFADFSDSAMAFTGVEWSEVFPGGITLFSHWYFNTKRVYVPLPLNYSDHLVQDVDYTIYHGFWQGGVLVDSAKNECHDNIVIDVDAYGTMITPYDVFPVIRIKEVTNGYNSRYLWTQDGWVFDELNTESQKTLYRWYTNDFFEVGSCDGDGKSAGNNFTFFRSETYVGQQEPLKNISLEIIPNPATNLINLNTSSVIEKAEIVNLSGTIVQTEYNSASIDISNLKPGMYMLKAKTGKGVETGRFIKQ